MDPLNVVAQIAAIVGAIPLIIVAPVEMFFVDRPWAQRFMHVDVDNVADAELWSFCIGFRNLIAGVGVIIGLVILWTGDVSVGNVVVITVSWYMLLSSLAMVLADLLGKWRPRGGSLIGTVGSSIPPLVVLIAASL